MLLDGRVEKFLAVARSGSISQAAKELYVSQPSLTTQIRKLEEEVGFPLFERTPRGTELTEIGTAFREAVERAQAICERAVAEGRAAATARNESIAIGLLDSNEVSRIRPALDALHSSHPEIDIELTVVPHPFKKRQQMLADGLIDCFFYGMREEDLGEDLVIFPFFSTGESLVMPLDYDLAQAGEILPGDLSGRTVILPKEDYSVSPTKSLREQLLEAHPGIDIQEQAIDAAFIQNIPYLDHPFVTLEKILGDLEGVSIAPLRLPMAPAVYGLVYPRRHGRPLDLLLACLRQTV